MKVFYSIVYDTDSFLKSTHSTKTCVSSINDESDDNVNSCYHGLRDPLETKKPNNQFDLTLPTIIDEINSISHLVVDFECFSHITLGMIERFCLCSSI